MRSHSEELGWGPQHSFLFCMGVGVTIQPTTVSFTSHSWLVGGGPWSLMCKSRDLAPERAVSNPSLLTCHETLDWYPTSSSAKVGTDISANQVITKMKQPVGAQHGAWCRVHSCLNKLYWAAQWGWVNDQLLDRESTLPWRLISWASIYSDGCPNAP